MENSTEERIPITEWPVTASPMGDRDQTKEQNPNTSQPQWTFTKFNDEQLLTSDEPAFKKSKLNTHFSQNIEISQLDVAHQKQDHHWQSLHTNSTNISVRYRSNLPSGRTKSASGKKGRNYLDPSDNAEPLAQARVARWWRRYKHLDPRTLPETNNPNTLLHYISRSEECRNFLQEERRKLIQKATLHKDQADLQAALASIDDWLGNFSSALERISQAVQLEPDNSEYRWLKAKLQRQCRMIRIQDDKIQTDLSLVKTMSLKVPSMLEVERISARDLSVDKFIEHYVQTNKPVIILDAVKEMAATEWNLEFIQSKAGSLKVTVKHAVPQSVEWARLEESHETTVGEFIDLVHRGETSNYLFDWSLPLHCPSLANDLTLPKYFSNNFLRKTAPGSLYHDSWPSLFIAPKGVVSNLHVDAFASSFWMALFEGQKRWTFFDEEDVPLLYPNYVHSMDPVFSVDLSCPDVQKFPLLALTKPKQCILNPGELLYVPAGSPHYVENLTISLAVSSNHVDHSNYKQVCEELRVNGLLDPRAADLLQQLEDPEFLLKVQR